MPEPVRIKDIPESELTLEQAKVFNDLVAGRGRLLTPYKIWIHSPRLAAALETIGTFLNKKSSLSEREVELVICIAANHWKGEYVWTVHVRTCVKLGIPQSVFDARPRVIVELLSAGGVQIVDLLDCPVRACDQPIFRSRRKLLFRHRSKLVGLAGLANPIIGLYRFAADGADHGEHGVSLTAIGPLQTLLHQPSLAVFRPLARSSGSSETNSSRCPLTGWLNASR